MSFGGTNHLTEARIYHIKDIRNKVLSKQIIQSGKQEDRKNTAKEWHCGEKHFGGCLIGCDTL